MTLLRIAVLAGLLLVGSAAAADTTAIYKARSKTIPITMTVEIGNDGSARYQMSTGRTYGLVLGGVDYFVEMSAKGPVVDRADDHLTAQKEAMAAFMPAFRHHDTSDEPPLVPIGKVTINGRTGQAFGYKLEKNGATPTTGFVFDPGPELAQVGKITTKESTEPEARKAIANTVVVISDDPELAELGKVMANQFGKSIAMLSGMIGETPGMAKEMQAILKTGAPLRFAGMDLASVNHAPIDPKRFELPAQPETLDQIRERMKPLPAPPTARPPVVVPPSPPDQPR